MADLSYGSQGVFEEKTGSISVEIAIPTEDPSNKYLINPMFNLSKSINEETQINVVFCQLTLEIDNGNELRSNDYDFNLEINTKELLDFKGVESFDLTLKESLFILYHDNSFDPDDVKVIFDNIERLNEMARGGVSNLSIDDLKGIQPLRPKKVGLGVIVKR